MKLQFVAKKPSYKDYPNRLIPLGDHLLKARLDRSLSQVELADMLGVAEMSINAWELNRNEPTAKFAKKIIAFMGYVPIEWQNAPIPLKLRYARLISGKTQSQVASEIGLDYTTIQMIEKGSRKSSRNSVLSIEKFFTSVVIQKEH